MRHATSRSIAAFLFVSTIVGSLLLAACGSSTSPTAATAPGNTGSSASACGVLNGGQALQAIVSGTACSSANSSVVSLTRWDGNGQMIGSGCSGTVIAARAVLTAGHCLNGVGAVAISAAGTTIQGTGFTRSDSQDVGVIVTGQDIPLRPFALLSSRSAVVGERAVIAGFGLDENGAGGTLRAGAATISAVNSDYVQTQFAADGSGSGLCSGDSGGALLVFQGGGWVLAGIPVSISAGCTQAGTDSFVNVQNPGVASFISQTAPGVTWR